jgi:hypothetical protein
MQRLCEELVSSRSKFASWDERINQARSACEAWQREAEESNRKASIAEQQRDEVCVAGAYLILSTSCFVKIISCGIMYSSAHVSIGNTFQDLPWLDR